MGFLMKFKYLFFILFATLLHSWFSFCLAQEHYENPFHGKSIVVVTDGSPASFAGLSVLLGVSEFSLKGIVITRPAVKKMAEAYLKKVPKVLPLLSFYRR